MQPEETGILDPKESAATYTYTMRDGTPTLKKTGRLVKGLLQAVEQVDIELFVFVNVLTDTLQDDHLHKPLDDYRLSRDKNPSRGIAGIRCPGCL